MWAVLVCLSALALCPRAARALCEHEGLASNNDTEQLLEGRPVVHTLAPNASRNYLYENDNVTTMNQPDRYRKLVLMLEPCMGVVYLFVRKTRRCWPHPHSCCRPLSGQPGADGAHTVAPPCNPSIHSVDCDWTHFHSIIDGSKDSAPTFFEVPLSSNKYYITVYAPEEANAIYGIDAPSYRLTALADIGAYPRPGQQGRLKAKQSGEMSLELEWEQATFLPVGVSDIRHYHIFSSLLLANERKLDPSVFLNPGKVMNSVCGLERNAVRYGVPLNATHCRGGACTATIAGIVPGRRYMFNIVSESRRGFNASYSGIIVSPDWEETTQLLPDSVVALIGAICGTVFGVVVVGYLWIGKLYN